MFAHLSAFWTVILFFCLYNARNHLLLALFFGIMTSMCNVRILRRRPGVEDGEVRARFCMRRKRRKVRLVQEGDFDALGDDGDDGVAARVGACTVIRDSFAGGKMHMAASRKRDRMLRGERVGGQF